jgi:hypothetical protein
MEEKMVNPNNEKGVGSLTLDSNQIKIAQRYMNKK